LELDHVRAIRTPRYTKLSAAAPDLIFLRFLAVDFSAMLAFYPKSIAFRNGPDNVHAWVFAHSNASDFIVSRV
jgi:hypothetical protein